MVNRKSKRAIFQIGIASFFALLCMVVHSLYPYIGINLLLNTLPSFSSANGTQTFYGENIDMSQILPGSQHYVINSKGKDLIDMAADLGINLIRITNIHRSFDNGADSIYTSEQWNQVLGKMQSKGIRALILIEVSSNDADYYTPDIQPIYLHLVQEYINSKVFANPDVYAVDLKNEPVLTDANVKMIKAAHTIIKDEYPDLKQTVGWWATPTSSKDPYDPNSYNWSDFASGLKVDKLVNFYSIHMYGLATNNFGINVSPNLRTKAFLSQVQNGLKTKKPILIEEFGEANGDAVSDQDTIGSPALQADVYQGVYQALKEMHSKQIIGAVAFDFYSRDQYPDAWAIVKNNGDYLYPAAYVLQKYALGKNIPSPTQTVTVDTSQSYLVKNDSNNTTINLHIADRLGLKLQLDTSRKYTAYLNTDGILLPIADFYYLPVADSYYAVYQAKSKGSVQLTIVPNDSCIANPCTPPMYTLTIDVV